jgi:hypothetical protein
VIETNPTEKLLHLEIGCAFSLQAPRYCGSCHSVASGTRNRMTPSTTQSFTADHMML